MERFNPVAACISALVIACAACSNEQSTTGAAPQTKDGARAKAPARIEWIKAPAEGDAADVVQRELTRAKADGRALLVYVGAEWCEPCERFHRAAEAGELDAEFPGLRLIEFDLDRDRERLTQAGYASKMIPLFEVPRADGTGSGERIEGSVKGDAAIRYIADRLRPLLH